MYTLIPPFCPNKHCVHHRIEPGQRYVDYICWGSYQTATFGSVPRYRCTACGKTFSTQTFRVDYFAKRNVDYEGLAERLCSCSSLRVIGRALQLSSDSVSNRIGRAACQVLAAESRLTESRRHLDEALAADGFESYCVSQYFPNNIHLLVGSESQHVYAVDHATLRRKGRMTKHQKRRRSQLDVRFRPQPEALRQSFARIADESLRVLSDLAHSSLTLWTDEKSEYSLALRSSACVRILMDQGRILHKTISSRAARTRDNPLFPVNYLDRELRKDLHEHVRETVCFGRNVNRQMERLTLYLFMHNYCKPYRIPGDRRTHAEVAGYDPRCIAEELWRIWERRSFLSLTELTPSMEATWLRQRMTPLKEGEEYLPAFVAA